MGNKLASAVMVMMLGVAAGCGSPQPTGPRDAGVTARAYVGEAELEIRYRYESLGAGLLRLHVDVVARGDVGEIAFAVEPAGFQREQGELAWRLAPAPGAAQSRAVTLRSTAGTPSVQVITTHVERGAELARDTISFIAVDDGLRECRPGDDAC